MSSDKIYEALGRGPTGALPSVEVIPPGHDGNGRVSVADAEDDFEYARRNVRDIIDSGKESLEQIQQIALAAESPKAFEVVSMLIDKLVVANEKLVDLSSRKAKNDAAANGQNADRVVNNTQNVVIVGTTDDLLKAVRRARGEKDVEDTLQR